MVSVNSIFFTLALLFSIALAMVPVPLDRRAPKTCKECTDSPNNCDITAPCASAFGQRLFCGCRPGYRASYVDPSDTSKQWRFNIPYHEHRVWVAPGVKCDTLCSWPYGAQACTEVHTVNGDTCVVFPPPQ